MRHAEFSPNHWNCIGDGCSKSLKLNDAVEEDDFSFLTQNDEEEE